ncbi:MAG: AMP-binding protein [Actinomycetes bacterium]
MIDGPDVRSTATVVEILDPARWIDDGRLAIVEGERTWTYADLAHDLEAAIARIAGATAPGDAVALLAVNDAPTLIGLCGILAAGRVAVPIDPRDPPTRAQRALALTRPALALCTGTPPDDSDWVRLADLPAAGSPRTPDRAPDDPALVIFTSGSTGVPKGIVRTVGMLTADGMQALTSTGRLAFTYPISFLGAITGALAAFDRGAALVFVDPTALGVARLVEVLRRRRVTYFAAPPTFLDALAGRVLNGGGPLPDITHLGAGGEPLLPAVVERLRLACPGVTVNNGYGTQECGSLTVSVLGPDEPVPDGPVSVGRPFLDGAAIAVLDASGDPVPAGETGEICGYGPRVTTEYLCDPDGTAARRVALDGMTGIRTGDLGFIDADGLLHVVGRSTQRVKILGQGVDLLEVETALGFLPWVTAAVVSAVPDARHGNRLVAHLATDRTVTTADVRHGLADRIPTAMHPRRVLTYDALPHTSRDKIDRRTLDALALEADDPFRSVARHVVGLGPVRGRPTALLVVPDGAHLGPLLPLTVATDETEPPPADVVVVTVGPRFARRRVRSAITTLTRSGTPPVAVIDVGAAPDVAALRAEIAAAVAGVRRSSPPDPADRP